MCFALLPEQENVSAKFRRVQRLLATNNCMVAGFMGLIAGRSQFSSGDNYNNVIAHSYNTSETLQRHSYHDSNMYLNISVLNRFTFSAAQRLSSSVPIEPCYNYSQTVVETGILNKYRFDQILEVEIDNFLEVLLDEADYH